jgi:hypothetical protein
MAEHKVIAQPAFHNLSDAIEFSKRIFTHLKEE